jgi:anthranilate/para-aminobenzoate synthase component I
MGGMSAPHGGVRVRVRRPVRLVAPLDAYAKALGDMQEHVLLLDTAVGTHGRSLLALETSCEILAYRGAFAGRRHEVRVLVRRPGASSAEKSMEDPLDVIRAELARVRETHGDVLDTSYACGYLAYEAAGFFHKLPELSPHRPGEPPDLAFHVVTAFLAEDRTGAAHLSALGTGDTIDTARRDADKRLDAQEQRLRALDAEIAAAPKTAHAAHIAAPHALPDAAREDYEAAVTRCIEYIAAGDVFELCLTRELRAPYTCSPWALYGAMRTANPASRGAFLSLGGVTILSTSPELLLRGDATGHVETRPIKGTRPRGTSPAEDEALRIELGASPKDRAENVMIVDLARHELGQVARLGSVQVPALFQVESHPLVHHLVSSVTAELRGDQDIYDAIRAVFPAGSMTGAPKVQAIKTLRALEQRSRGVYAGALGYIGADGSCELAVVIRTVILHEGVARIGTGGAITADSLPADEYQETCVKVAGLWALLGA